MFKPSTVIMGSTSCHEAVLEHHDTHRFYITPSVQFTYHAMSSAFSSMPVATPPIGSLLLYAWFLREVLRIQSRSKE
jgi:hypothetical protein